MNSALLQRPLLLLLLLLLGWGGDGCSVVLLLTATAWPPGTAVGVLEELESPWAGGRIVTGELMLRALNNTRIGTQLEVVL